MGGLVRLWDPRGERRESQSGADRALGCARYALAMSSLVQAAAQSGQTLLWTNILLSRWNAAAAPGRRPMQFARNGGLGSQRLPIGEWPARSVYLFAPVR